MQRKNSAERSETRTSNPRCIITTAPTRFLFINDDDNYEGTECQTACCLYYLLRPNEPTRDLPPPTSARALMFAHTQLQFHTVYYLNSQMSSSFMYSPHLYKQESSNTITHKNRSLNQSGRSGPQASPVTP